MDYLWRERWEIRDRIRQLEDKAYALGQQIGQVDQAMEANIDALRQHLHGEMADDVRVNALALPALALALVIDSVASWIVLNPVAVWGTLALAVVVLIPTLHMAVTRFRRSK
ncbi:hypothetical protein MF406_07160 [Georgenia sp. TF02-10]|uniref:hypothetical protein n=1 Tax=Georgenia sp. TF02-10 TaxID=2917725 RepID=UPI001FA6D61C|nr:hypothetical protein [Georgenia sp. TF02-10]UNX55992.1 hypothetical protein MF406_07160 [Georgenia sp. TF02-10]